MRLVMENVMHFVRDAICEKSIVKIFSIDPNHILRYNIGVRFLYEILLHE